MPVWKFRAFEAARRALWMSPDDDALLPRMTRLAAMARVSRPVHRGVTRYRTIADAKRAKGTHWQPRSDLLR